MARSPGSAIPPEVADEPGLVEADVRAVARLLSRAASVLLITGAGVSAESGLPTYRGINGLYGRDLTDEGMPIETALSGSTFLTRPELTWRYLSQIERACRDAAPSQAHRWMAALEQRIPRTWVFTQNVDGLHYAAGSRNVIEIHGNIHRARCVTCGHREVVAAAPGPRHWDAPCARCGRPLRPDVVLFDEPLPKDAVATFEREWQRGFDLVMVIGTTAAFPYIAGPIVKAARAGVPTVEINPETTDLSHFVTYRLGAKAGVTLQAIADHYSA